MQDFLSPVFATEEPFVSQAGDWIREGFGEEGLPNVFRRFRDAAEYLVSCAEQAMRLIWDASTLLL
jgi:hypothetical protein